MSDLRVLILDPAPFVGGAQVNLRHMARLWKQMSIEPVIALPLDCGDTVKAYYAEHFGSLRFVPMAQPSYHLSRITLGPLTIAAKAIGHLAKSEGVDVIFASSQRSGGLAALVKMFMGIKSVWRLCDMGVPWPLKPLTALVDRVTCVSQAVYDSYRVVPRGHFRIVPTGVWADPCEPAELHQRRSTIRSQLGIPPGAPVLGAVCNLQYWKGLHVVLAAFREVLDRVPDAHLIHVGGKSPAYRDYPERIAELIVKLDLGTRVKLLGFVPEPLPYYAAFDVFVHLPVPQGRVRHPEAFGQVAAEAMAYRVPVVAARLGGLPEVVADQWSGLLVEPNNPKVAADEVVKLLANPSERRVFGERGFQRYQAMFTIQREAYDYAALFKELVR